MFVFKCCRLALLQNKNRFMFFKVFSGSCCSKIEQSSYPMFLFFQNKNQFLNRFHVFVRECLVSVIENSKNKSKYLFILPHT